MPPGNYRRVEIRLAHSLIDFSKRLSLRLKIKVREIVDRFVVKQAENGDAIVNASSDLANLRYSKSRSTIGKQEISWVDESTPCGAIIS